MKLSIDADLEVRSSLLLSHHKFLTSSSTNKQREQMFVGLASVFLAYSKEVSMESVRGFPLMKGLILAMGMLGFSVGHGRASTENRFTLHYEAHPKEAPSVRKGMSSGAASVSA